MTMLKSNTLHTSRRYMTSESTSSLRGLLASVLLAVAASAAIAAQPPPLKPFTASYQANYLGLQGTGTMTLATVGGGRWDYRFEIDGTIAKLSQNTIFEADGGVWRPLSSNDKSSMLIKKSSKQATYDWNTREARWNGDVKPDRTGPVALRKGDIDAMMINLAIPRDVAAGKPLDYRMVDDGRAKQMTYEVVGPESIEIDGRSQTATKVTRSDGDKQTVLWVVDGIPVPVRILQRKKGKDEMDLRLQSVR